ncbi:MAG: hypothetical protein ACFE8B_00625 [Candidatus Hermodarchaeota archaeon]
MTKNKKNYYKNISLLVILPQCYGNFNNKSDFCRVCDVNEMCKEIPPPKEPEWCNPA